MRVFDFYERYEIEELLCDGPTASHRALEAGGRPVMVHFLHGSPEENEQVMSKVRALEPLAMRFVIQVLEVSGVQVIVTAPLEPFETFDRWLGEQLPAEGVAPISPPMTSPVEPVEPPLPPQAGAFTALFSTDSDPTTPPPMDEASSPSTADPAPATSPPVSPPPMPPTMPPSTAAADPAEPSSSGSTPLEESKPGEFTALFGTGSPASSASEAPVSPPSEPGLESPSEPGAFTSLFGVPGATEASGPAPAPPGTDGTDHSAPLESTQRPAAEDDSLDRLSGPSTPAESLRDPLSNAPIPPGTFNLPGGAVSPPERGSALDPETPSPPVPLPPVPELPSRPVADRSSATLSNMPLPSAPPPPLQAAGGAPGEFTQLFGGPAASEPPPAMPSEPEPIAAGGDDYLAKLGQTAPESSRSVSPPPIRPDDQVWTAPAQSGPSEFTRIVSSDRMPLAAAPAPIRPEAAKEPEALKKKPSNRGYVFGLIAIVVIAITLVVLIAVLGRGDAATDAPAEETPVQSPQGGSV